MFYVYVLWSDKLNKRYIGQTENVQQRLINHNKGKNQFTKSGIPWKLIYVEELPDRTSAIKRERFLKSGQGRKFLDGLRLFTRSESSQPEADTPLA